MKKYGLPKVKNMLKTPKMKSPKKHWEEEFVDGALIIKCGGLYNFSIDKHSMDELAEKYLGCPKIENILTDDIPPDIKIKIKARKGCIQIERIK